MGEISVENPEAAGGLLDVDGNMSMQIYNKAIEHIYWPDVEPTRMRHPPLGEYSISIRVHDKQDSWSHACYTLFTRVAGREEVIHGRIPPDVTDVEVCTLYYDGPKHDFMMSDMPR